MPRTIFPPTPAPSMDIVGKDGGPQLPPKDKASSFTLPPPAIAPSPKPDAQSDDDGQLQTKTESGYSLPPPPTRTRKIIQMTPKMDPKGDMANASTATTPATGRLAATSTMSATRKATGKKQPSSTSQAGKRIARKTAHSVIERRRRSKMNDEFGVLKNMIPACQNQDMHKLAILQASIEYLRYLEQCVTDLTAANGLKSALATQKCMLASKPSIQNEQQLRVEYGDDDDDDDDENDDGESTDVEMTGPPEPLTLHENHQQRPQAYASPYSISTSPALDALHPQHDFYKSSLSGLPSPAIWPQMADNPRYLHQSPSSASTSPTLVPASSKEADEEATAALLMLNKDRRNTTISSSSSSGRGMSVKDLLSP